MSDFPMRPRRRVIAPPATQAAPMSPGTDVTLIRGGVAVAHLHGWQGILTDGDAVAPGHGHTLGQALPWPRAQRNALLTWCDWTQVADAPLTAEKKAEWDAYRKALRDLPTTCPDPMTVVWPVAPT